jgi:hypothetical protein
MNLRSRSVIFSPVFFDLAGPALQPCGPRTDLCNRTLNSWAFQSLAPILDGPVTDHVATLAGNYVKRRVVTVEAARQRMPAACGNRPRQPAAAHKRALRQPAAAHKRALRCGGHGALVHRWTLITRRRLQGSSTPSVDRNSQAGSRATVLASPSFVSPAGKAASRNNDVLSMAAQGPHHIPVAPSWTRARPFLGLSHLFEPRGRVWE